MIKEKKISKREMDRWNAQVEELVDSSLAIITAGPSVSACAVRCFSYIDNSRREPGAKRYQRANESFPIERDLCNHALEDWPGLILHQ
jgi:hypothetical protein